MAKTAIAKSLSYAAGEGGKIVELPLSFAPKDLGAAIFRMLLGDGSDYSFSGAMDVSTPFGDMSLPLEKVGKTVFSKAK